MTNFSFIRCIILFAILFIANSCSDTKTPTITKTGTVLDEISWIAGTWTGTAFGGKTEEVWSLPSGGSMMGMFKAFDDNEISFYELMTLTIKNDKPHMTLKHFDKKLVGWEEKAESVEFPFQRLTDNELVFDGLSFKRISNTQMNVYVNIDGEIVEFKYYK